MPSVSSAYQQSVVSFLVSLGIDSKEIPIPLRPDPLTCSRVLMEDYINLLNKGAELTGDPLFGFALGKHIQAKDYGVLGYLVESCENLEQAIQALTRFDALVADIGTTTVLYEIDDTRIQWTPRCIDCKQMVLRNTTAWVATVYKILGPASKLTAITFTFSLDKSEQGILQEWFGCKVTGNADSNSIIFPRHLLYVPFTSENKAMFNALVEVTEKELLSQNKSAAFQLSNNKHEEIKHKAIALLRANPTLKKCDQQRLYRQYFQHRILHRAKAAHQGKHIQALFNVRHAG